MKDIRKEDMTAHDFIKSILNDNSDMSSNAYDHYMRKIEISQDEITEFIMGYHEIDQNTSKLDIKKILEENYSD